MSTAKGHEPSHPQHKGDAPIADKPPVVGDKSEAPIIDPKPPSGEALGPIPPFPGVGELVQPGFEVMADDMIADGDERVAMEIPTSFVLTLDDHRKMRLRKGLNNVPVKSLGQVVADHLYIQLHGGTLAGAAPEQSLAWSDAKQQNRRA